MTEKDARYKSLMIITVELAFLVTGLVIFMEISLHNIGSWFKYAQENYLYLVLLIPAVLGFLLILGLYFRAAFYVLFAMGFAPIAFFVYFIVRFIPIRYFSPANLLGAILPLLFVLGITMLFLIPNIIYIRSMAMRRRNAFAPNSQNH